MEPLDFDDIPYHCDQCGMPTFKLNPYQYECVHCDLLITLDAEMIWSSNEGD